MQLEIWQAGRQTKLELADGPMSVGGGEGDGVRIEGLAPAALRLSVEGARLMVQASPALGPDEVLFPPGVPRLMMAGESLSLLGEILIRRPASADGDEQRLNSGTAQVLRALLFEAPEPRDTRAATLHCLTGLDLGRSYPLAARTAEIGRGARVQVRVRDRAVSRLHARLVHESGEFLVESLGGHKAVYLNGTRVHGRVALADGAVIGLGHSVLRFNAPAAPRAPVPAPLGAAKREPDEKSVERPSPALPTASRIRPFDWVLLAAGATLAVSGLLVSWGLSSLSGG